jgi:ATP-dependent protease Clp ATPase subunit
VLNQSCGHGLLFDVLNVTIIMSLKLKEEFGISFNLQDLIDEMIIFVVAHELSLLASNIRREICGILNIFLSFQKKYEGNKARNMLSLMLDPRFKSLRLVSSFIGRKQVVSIVEDYDQQSLFPMLLRCYHILHLMAKFGPMANR